jgi:hypothetical protein
VALLILKAYELGYEVSLGEAWRTPEQARANAAKGTGISNSLHMDRLAVDLNLFKDGVFLTKTEDHRELGEWWESRHELARWGGRFTRPDGNHYSFTHGGRS